MDAIKLANKQIQLTTAPIPKISLPQEVLVKVAYSGLCGTDLHIIQGKFPCSQVILGHEFSGTVVDCGSAVKNLTKGDHVVVDPNNSCYKCHFCHSKNPHFCPTGGSYANLGTRNDGGWADYCICSMEQIHKVPEGISLKMAALTEPLSCIAHGWDLISPITVGRDILVMGGGIIGTLWICLLHSHGHRRVTIVEINPLRLQSLKTLTEDFNYNLKTPKDLENGRNEFDVIIDCTGHCPAIELGMSLLNRGGKFCIFGVAPPDARIKLSPFDIAKKELTIISVKVNPFSFPKALALIDTLGEKYFDYRKLGVKVFKLEEYPKALELLKMGTKLEVPKTTADGVLVKVAYSGICGTDLHIIQGEFPCNPNNTFTLGHEFSGTVVEVGQNVTNFKPGDKVSVDPNNGCKCCKFCHSGNPHFCKTGGINNTIGIYRDGGWANYALCPEEQPISCLAHGWDIVSPIHVGEKILVTGAGIIGNLWVCALHLQGHRNVTVSEPNTARLEMLKNLDTGFTLLTPDQLVKNQQADPNYLFDVAIDCSGYPPAVEHAISLLNSGGKLCIFGVAPPHGRISIAPFDIYMKEMKIFGVNINPFSFPKSLGLLEAMGDRYLNYDNLGIKTFTLSQYQEAIDCLKKGTIAKAVFKL
ncbi:D-arabinitol dehydrogenase 1 [Asbolus verrucosus]|uniref:D-arabinitol dehydrogenase 1 n=1 Tax=Asbolus verrucosus TaxID=1661398 RepID=A0A482VSI7_ASBVE|nr:D-arabinitol dehydrogenase 1 [Asbolus verrucosus]